MNSSILNDRSIVIAIDGPAGSGKSTAASILAEKLSYVHADSGAMYRTVTLALMRKFGGGNSREEFGDILAGRGVPGIDELNCRVVLEGNRQISRIGEEDVGSEIRSPAVTERIVYIANNPAYREIVNQMLRNFASITPLVVDGRDIGTVVFPDTSYKFFLEASIEIRASRRLDEYRSRGMTPPDRDKLIQEIQKRDDEDRSRPVGALKMASDAIYIDTSELGINDVVARLLGHLQVQF